MAGVADQLRCSVDKAQAASGGWGKGLAKSPGVSSSVCAMDLLSLLPFTDRMHCWVGGWVELGQDPSHQTRSAFTAQQRPRRKHIHATT